MKATNGIFYLGLLFWACLVSSCGSPGKKQNEIERQKLISVIESEKPRFPLEVGDGSGIYVDDVQIEKDMIVYSFLYPDEMLEVISLNKETSTSDRNLARTISYFGKLVQSYIDAGFGLKFIYKSSETREVLMEIEMSPEKLEEISKKLQNGEIEPYTLIELTRMELARMDVPVQIDEGVWLTDAYVKGNNIYYIATIENEIDKENISYSDIEEIKEGCIESIREERLFAVHKEEIFRENIHFISVYKDNRGIEVARIDISPEDLFKR